ncbi:30S ribosomal protein S9 [Patescibacteria group bacterium]|nr:30S ribosomal protein S9 [Patescibacteria group bacterium]MBU1966729.1 30S ribosomal protein S9 [Patescibacteria group bacterium]MBU2543743.1 30S ribosomal protein S9 [Patescibacteria group bacterium]
MARRQQQQHQPSQIEDKPNFDIPSGKYFEGLGRRKMATARVRIYEEKNGQCVVNDQLAKDYFSGIYNAVKVYTQPFELTGTQEKFAVTVKVDGSGINSQLEAIVHGLTRALVKYDESFKPLLKQEGLLTRDARMKETRKPGRGGKARRKRQSPKR